MGNIFDYFSHKKAISDEEKALSDLLSSSGDAFPGSTYRPMDRRKWMSELKLDSLKLDQIVWPGTHDSATNSIGIPFITRPFAECQTLSIYDQLAIGTRVLDIRVQKDGLICHGILTTYSIDEVLNNILRFVSEADNEIILLEIRTEYGQSDPPGFEKYLTDRLGEFLIWQDDSVFKKKVSDILPKRIICVWKPRNSLKPAAKGPLWSSGYLRDNWIDTDLPKTKFDSNMKYLTAQAVVTKRNYFYRVENTVTPNWQNPVVRDVANEIERFARLFLAQSCVKGVEDRMQVFSTDFITGDFVDACVALTHARVDGLV